MFLGGVRLAGGSVRASKGGVEDPKWVCGDPFPIEERCVPVHIGKGWRK